jgi:S-DNA-T family DNA segregation ATPase FtsK/SpoIIIE
MDNFAEQPQPSPAENQSSAADAAASPDAVNAAGPYGRGPAGPGGAPSGAAGGRSRRPSTRASVVLAVAMLTVGVAVGAAIGPTPATSLAGNGDIVQKLPALIAAVAARGHSQAAAQPAATTTQPPPITPQATPAAGATPAATSTTPAQSSTPASGETHKKSSTTPSKTQTGASKLPPITSVWLIELSGSSFNEAIANPTVAPYITGELIPKGTFLTGWSALSAGAFAGEAALVEHRASVGGTPPVLHTIVQPPCPEGPAGAACLPGTPPGIATADAFLKTALAGITANTTYSEHGLVVVTYATVAEPATAELPAGSAAATLATQPPAGVVLLSPFAKAGAKPAVTYDPSSPTQSLEKLLP